MAENKPAEIPRTTLPRYAREAAELALQLATLTTEELERMLRTNRQIAATNRRRYRQFHGEEALPALLAYTGVVFRHIAPERFTPGDFEYAQQHLNITSFLYGLLRPLDAIRRYRLEGDAVLPGHDDQTMFGYWQGRLTEAFLEKIHAQPDDPLFVHFEVVPDHLPAMLKDAIAQFPPGSLQFEVGIQTLNTTVQGHISRKTNLAKAQDNIRWLREHSDAHLHVDLIAGLPSETMDSFARGFNELYTWGAHEIQLGILKRLRGTPITRHTPEFRMNYNPEPPYDIIENRDVARDELADFKLFAKYWDHIANSGRFAQTLPLIVQHQPYERFAQLTQYLKNQWQRSHSIPLEKLYIAVAEWLISTSAEDEYEAIRNAVTNDYIASGAQGKLPWMTRGLTVQTRTQAGGHGQARQERHLS